MLIQMEHQLQTGDLVLFHGTGWISRALEWVGRSKYSHVGIVVKNPRFIHENLEDGLYLLDSSWGTMPDSEDHQIRFGVQLHKLDDILSNCTKGTVYVRRNHANRDPQFYETFRTIHTEIHAQPYDTNVLDWILAGIQLDHPIHWTCKYTNRFWCSALVSYVYCKLGWIQDVNWSLIAPREFGYENTGQLHFTIELSDEQLLF